MTSVQQQSQSSSSKKGAPIPPSSPKASAGSFTPKVAIYKTKPSTPLMMDIVVAPNDDNKYQHHFHVDNDYDDDNDDLLLEDVMDQVEAMMQLPPSPHHTHESSMMFTYQADDTWDDFCEDLPMEEP